MSGEGKEELYSRCGNFRRVIRVSDTCRGTSLYFRLQLIQSFGLKISTGLVKGSMTDILEQVRQVRQRGKLFTRRQITRCVSKDAEENIYKHRVKKEQNCIIREPNPCHSKFLRHLRLCHHYRFTIDPCRDNRTGLLHCLFMLSE